MDYDKMTIESLSHDCFKRSGYAINKQDLISRIEFLCEQYHQSKVNNGVLDGVIKCECGGSERVALDCTMKPCEHQKYKNIN
tara:strand:+ start:881 stop:1126 length:246 start_codon:yes stop_codon:yes gene_type:complete